MIDRDRDPWRPENLRLLDRGGQPNRKARYLMRRPVPRPAKVTPWGIAAYLGTERRRGEGRGWLELYGRFRRRPVASVPVRSPVARVVR